MRHVLADEAVQAASEVMPHVLCAQVPEAEVMQHVWANQASESEVMPRLLRAQADQAEVMQHACLPKASCHANGQRARPSARTALGASAGDRFRK